MISASIYHHHLYLLLLILLLTTKPSLQQQGDCSYINGQGCYNDICKFCAMCLPSSCILATPLSNGVNEGSTCVVTHQTQGYDFYNYCLSSGMDDNGDNCNMNTICYSYRQGNASFASHSWDNLTCNSNTCTLINFDGSSPVAPIPLDANSTTTATNVTTSTTTNHSIPGTGSGNSRPEKYHYYNQFDIKSGSPASIVLIIVCIILAICLLVWLTRILFYKTKHWPAINKYFCCGLMSYKIPPPRNNNTSTTPYMMDSSNMIMTPNTAPPSFIVVDDDELPSYFHQDPSPPKYEQAVVTQIRSGRMRLLDHHPRLSPLSSSTSSSSAATTNLNNNNTIMEQPIWIPIYLSQQSSSIAAAMMNSSLPPPQNDWATATMRHHPPPSSTVSSSLEEDDDEEEEEGEDIVNIHRQSVA